MKKTLITLCLILVFSVNNSALAKQKNSTIKSSADIIEGEVIELDNGSTNDLLQQTVEENQKHKAKIQQYYSFDKGLFKIHINDYLNVDFGAIGSVNWNVDRYNNNALHTNFDFDSIDIILSGKANEYIDYSAQVLPNRNINEQTILGNVWIRGKYKNYAIQLGRMRRPFAYSPTLSGYNLDFATKNQISRLFGDHRDTGGKITAEYKYADIALGLFANMHNRPFAFSNHGIEFDTSVTLKPLANFKDKGDLRLMGSIATGKKDYSYTNYSGMASYNYKKFGLRGEYICKEATNYGEKKANGYYIDGTYFITDKLQALVRFDSYNPDMNHSSRRINEYVAGLNYYLNNKNTMFVVNYAFIDGSRNSHRIAMQMRYRTW